MKLLDPFAGYRLASGHPFFHIALFVCSWQVVDGHDKNSDSSAEISSAFIMLRWGHFILFTLSMIEGWISLPSAINEESVADTEAVADEDKKLATVKVIHRDGHKKLIARILATISVFIYQGNVFYAQLVLAKGLLK